MSFLDDKTILLPVDFSKASRAAVRETISFAEHTTRIRILHVLVPLHSIAIEPGTLVDLASDEKRIAIAMEQMRKLIPDSEKSIECLARIGDPGSEIVDCAAEISADLIVMASHGRTGIKSLLLGSVAERVMRHAECAVMILRKN